MLSINKYTATVSESIELVSELTNEITSPQTSSKMEYPICISTIELPFYVLGLGETSTDRTSNKVQEDDHDGFFV